MYLTPKCNSAYGKYQSNDCIITHLKLETETYSEPYFSQDICFMHGDYASEMEFSCPLEQSKDFRSLRK